MKSTEQPQEYLERFYGLQHGGYLYKSRGDLETRDEWIKHITMMSKGVATEYVLDSKNKALNAYEEPCQELENFHPFTISGLRPSMGTSGYLVSVTIDDKIAIRMVLMSSSSDKNNGPAQCLRHWLLCVKKIKDFKVVKMSGGDGFKVKTNDIVTALWSMVGHFFNRVVNDDYFYEEYSLVSHDGYILIELQATRAWF